jgi:hypothetical protein
MTELEIIEMFDRNLNLTLRELAQISGKSVKEIKEILLK